MGWIGAVLKNIFHIKWIWFIGILSYLLGKTAQKAAHDKITWNCIMITSAILISEIFWLFELKNKKDEIILCTKNGNRWFYQVRAGIIWGMALLILLVSGL